MTAKFGMLEGTYHILFNAKLHCDWFIPYTDIAKFAGHLPHSYGNSRAIWDHTVLPATRQR